MLAIEQNSLRMAKWANLAMGIAGVAAALLSNASALMLDGLFSAVNFMAAVFAARVAASSRRAPDSTRPFGYEIDEPVYVMFRAMVLTGIILAAALGAANKIYTFASGGAIPPIRLGWVIWYIILMVAVCLSLAAWHNRNWKKTGKKSTLLRTERTAAIIDGVISSAAGAAFVIIAALKGTFLEFLVPISDAVVVLGLASFMIPQPISIFRNAMKEVLGETADSETTGKIHRAVERKLAADAFKLLAVVAARAGRSLFAAAYIKPLRAVSVEEIDEMRSRLRVAAGNVYDPIRMEIILTGEKPYE